MSRHTLPARSLILVAGTALAIFASGPSVARADDRDAEIDRLRRQVEAQAAEQQQMRAEIEALKQSRADVPDRSALRAAIDDLLAERRRAGTLDDDALRTGVSGALSGVRLGGYFSTIYRNSEAKGKFGSFVDNRFVLFAKSDITPKISFASEVEIEHGGISDEVDGEVVVEQAFIKFRESEEFALKAGTLLMPWGRFNMEHDDPLNELSSRPTVSRYIHGATFALPGIGVEGTLPACALGAMTYDVVLTNGLKDEIINDEGIRDARGLFEDDDNHGKTAFGRFGFIPAMEGIDGIDALSLGTSFAWGNVGTEGRGESDLRGYGFDASAKSGPFEFKGEWAHLGVDRPDSAAPAKSPGGLLGPVRGLSGWYGQALYRIREPWVRSLPFAEDSASLALVLRRDAVDLNDRVHGASPQDDERAWTFGINYRPTTRTVIKLEYRKAESGFAGDEGRDRDLIAVEFATYF